MFDDDWPRVHLGIVVSCYLATAQFIWIIGALKWRHLQASQSPLCVQCPPPVKLEQKKSTVATWLDHYFQVRGNIAVNSEVSSWLLDLKEQWQSRLLPYCMLLMWVSP